MRSVYKNAKVVVVWIDAKLDLSCVAMRKLREMSDRSVMADLGHDPNIWDKLRRIFKNPYWDRLWIQQESSFASSLIFQSANAMVSLYGLFHPIRLFNERGTEKDRTAALGLTGSTFLLFYSWIYSRLLEGLTLMSLISPHFLVRPL